jgi:predicted dehydrogenase
MSSLPEKPLKIAVVGCGAMTELRHLPALVRRNDVQIAALVDSNKTRAQKLADDFLVPRVLPNHQGLLDLEVDVAILAVPNHLHAPMSVELLRAGIHLLVEKPMALSVVECDSMLEAAAAGRALLAVGMIRRFVHAGRFTKEALRGGILGRVRSFDVRDGFVFNWPMASTFFFERKTAGGGVMMDMGVHVLDQLVWWLGDIESMDYRDNCYGGVESDCLVHVRMDSGVEGVVELSRTRNLRNSIIIRGERGELEVGTFQNFLFLRIPGEPLEMKAVCGAKEDIPVKSNPAAFPIQTQIDVVSAEHEDFLEAIRSRHRPEVSGEEGRQIIGLIEKCYAQRRPLELPWLSEIPVISERVQ